MTAEDGPSLAGRYLYADYTPFDENKNFLEMLKDFVSVSEQLLKTKAEVEALSSALSGAESLYKTLSLQFREFKSGIHSTMGEYGDKFKEIIEAGGQTERPNIFQDSKATLAKLLDDTEVRFSAEFGNYKDYLASRIIQLNKTSVHYLQEWLLRDYYALPYTLTTSMSTSIDASIETGAKDYKISRTTTIAFDKSSGSDHLLTPYDAASSLNSVSYSFQINSAELEFWNHRRKVSDLGLKDIMVPIGFRTPISEKLKRPFKFSKSKPVEKEPDFVNIESYYLMSITMTNSKLTAIVTSDLSRPDYDMIRIVFRHDQLSSANSVPDQSLAPGGRPEIEYYTKDDNGNIVQESDILQFTEILNVTDVRKIMVFGKVLADRLSMLSDRSIVTPRSKLSFVRLDNEQKYATIIRDDSLTYDPILIVAFLESIAAGFSSLVSKIRQKSIEGELILRQELEGGIRREHVLKIEELRSRLSFSQEGRVIAKRLGLDQSTPETKGVAYPS